jgi:hypothetical protein
MNSGDSWLGPHPIHRAYPGRSVLVAGADGGVRRLTGHAGFGWTNSHFVAAIGGATLEVVNKHVENHRNV